MSNVIKFICAVLLAVLTANASSDQTEVRRYLLSAGANNGGRERVLLRYAVSDAKAFAAVLTEMGGIDKNGAFVLSNPSGRELLGNIAAINKLVADNKMSAPDVRSEVFVYYSGHADRDGLKLGGETLSWADFRSAVNGIEADIRVAVIDACGSGAITRTKGGMAYPAFLSDASSNMRGYAFLTSSNENESSQECDRLRGSFFTHALLSGMRGAADLTGDGKVTINEAYQYAFNETLQNTQNTTVGTQHPSRDMNLAGTGDVIMTDLRGTSAILTLAADIEGRFFIRDERGHLFTELRKTGGRQTELGLPPGRYSVQMEALSQKWTAGNVVVTDGQKTTLDMSSMRSMERRRRTIARGDAGTEAPLPYSMNASLLCLSFAYGSGDNVRLFPAARGVGDGQFGLINIAGELEIFQAGVINSSNYTGRFQAGVINTVNEVGRFQAGLVNAANIASGVQIGAVNAAMQTGRQIGLVNIARHSDKTPVGVISIVGNGIYDVTTYTDITGDATASLRTGTPWFYNLFEYGSTAHRYHTRQRPAAGWGMGTRFGMNGPFTLNLDFVWQSMGSKRDRENETNPPPNKDRPNDEVPPNSFDPNHPTNKPNHIPGNPDNSGFGPPKIDINADVNFRVQLQDYLKLRMGAGYNFHPSVGITGGVSLNGFFDSFTDEIIYKPFGGFYYDRKFRDFKMRMWPSIYAGLTIGKLTVN